MTTTTAPAVTTARTTEDPTAVPAAAPTAAEAAGSPARRTRRWASLVAALVAFLGIGLLVPAQASAAGYATVSVCFTVPGGAVYPGGPHAGSVNYQVRTAPSWIPATNASFRGSANGCSVWTVHAGIQFRFQAWSTSAGVVTCGNTPWYLGPRAGSSLHLGTFNAFRSATGGRECR